MGGPPRAVWSVGWRRGRPEVREAAVAAEALTNRPALERRGLGMTGGRRRPRLRECRSGEAPEPDLRGPSEPALHVCPERLCVQTSAVPRAGKRLWAVVRLRSVSLKGGPREHGRHDPHLLRVGGGHLRDARNLDAAPGVLPQVQKAGGRVQEVPDHFVVNLG